MDIPFRAFVTKDIEMIKVHGQTKTVKYLKLSSQPPFNTSPIGNILIVFA